MNEEVQPPWEHIAARYNLADQPEWQKLLNLIDLSEHFALVVLLVVDTDGALLCRHEIERELHSKGKKLVALELTTPASLRRLPKHFLDLSVPPDAGCLWVAGVEPDYSKMYSEWRNAWQTALAQLNAHRNPIRDKFSQTIIFVGAPWLQEVMRETAPDLWSVRTLVSRIEPSARTFPTPKSPQIKSLPFDGEFSGGDPTFALQQAEKMRGVPGKELAMADLLHRAGDGFAHMHNWQEAERAFRNAFELKRLNSAPSPSLLRTLVKLGIACQSLGRTTEAILLYQQGIDISRNTNESYIEAVLLGNLSSALLEQGAADRAIKTANISLDIAHKFLDRKLEANALGNLGNACMMLSDNRKAIEYFEQSLAIYRDLNDRRNEGASISNLGICHASLGDLHKAIEYYQRALPIARSTKDLLFESNILGNLGNAYLQLDNARAAVDYYVQSLTIARQIGYRYGEGADLGSLGLAYRLLGEPQKAIESLKQSLELHRQTGARHWEGSSLANLGSVYLELEDTRQALNLFEQAVGIAREVGDRSLEANALFEWANALEKSGDRSKAIQRAELALKTYQAISDPNARKVQVLLSNWKTGQK